MKKVLVMSAAILAMSSANAFAGDFFLGLNLGGPAYYAPPPPRPVYVAPQPVYYYPSYYQTSYYPAYGYNSWGHGGRDYHGHNDYRGHDNGHHWGRH